MTPKQKHKRATQEHLSRPRFALGQELGERHVMRSACTGKGCNTARHCARVRRRGNTIYNGPLLHLMESDCVDYNLFVSFSKSRSNQKYREAA